MALKLSTAAKNQTFNALRSGVSADDSLNGGYIMIYSGSQPATADSAVTGTPLLKITASSGPYAQGVLQTTDDDGVCASQAATSGTPMTLNGVTAGTLGVGYYVTIASVGAEDLRTACFRITGTGNNDEAIIEYIQGGNNASVTTTNTFKTVSEIYPLKPAVFSSNVKVGYGITNGLFFGLSSSGVMTRHPGQVWSGVGLAAAGTGTTAGWFRHFTGSEADDGSAVATHARIDGRISTSGAEMSLSNITIVENASTTVDVYSLAWPSTL